MKYVKTYESWFSNLFGKSITNNDLEYILQKLLYYINDNDLYLIDYFKEY